MKTAIVVLLVLAGLALMVYSWFAVGAEDESREQIDEKLQARSLAEYRRRAEERAADPTRRPDPATCSGRVRKPIPLEGRESRTVDLTHVLSMEPRGKQLTRPRAFWQ